MNQVTNQSERQGRANNRPVHTVRYGSFRAAVWERVVDSANNGRPMYSVRFSRS